VVDAMASDKMDEDMKIYLKRSANSLFEAVEEMNKDRPALLYHVSWEIRRSEGKCCKP